MVWDALADRFDDEPDHGLGDPVVRQAWTSLLQEVLPAPPARVVDLGCGTGTLSVVTAQLGHQVVGVDLSPRMLDRAADKAARCGVEVDLRVGDASSPPVQGSFDAVVVRHVLWALPDAPAALDRWVDLLRPGGALVLVEGRWHTGGGWSSDALLALVAARTRAAGVRDLSGQAALWGCAVTDERYLITAHV